MWLTNASHLIKSGTVWGPPYTKGLGQTARCPPLSAALQVAVAGLPRIKAGLHEHHRTSTIVKMAISGLPGIKTGLHELRSTSTIAKMAVSGLLGTQTGLHKLDSTSTVVKTAVLGLFGMNRCVWFSQNPRWLKPQYWTFVALKRGYTSFTGLPRPTKSLSRTVNELKQGCTSFTTPHGSQNGFLGSPRQSSQHSFIGIPWWLKQLFLNFQALEYICTNFTLLPHWSH